MKVTTKTVHCDDCGTDVRLHKTNGTLNVSCGCDSLSIKVATVLPEGWNDE